MSFSASLESFFIGMIVTETSPLLCFLIPKTAFLSNTACTKEPFTVRCFTSPLTIFPKAFSERFIFTLSVPFGIAIFISSAIPFDSLPFFFASSFAFLIAFSTVFSEISAVAVLSFPFFALTIISAVVGKSGAFSVFMIILTSSLKALLPPEPPDPPPDEPPLLFAL